MPCPCGLDATFSECCGRFHAGARSGDAVAETPEQLMRSRYSAFVMGDEAYLRFTWHPDTCPDVDLSEGPDWERLEVLASDMQGDAGFVHFRAYYWMTHEGQRQLGVLEERSVFTRIEGHWLYVTGDIGTTSGDFAS
ncbi:MAG: Zn-binding protein [Idiomarina sp.]|nr:Zn-binding protein [Idiomarina sp.]